ncbi:ATP-binding protein [Siphonobacter sp.]|uniref:ATP-binding protein n=1 Tax=Siphonobacter sp. TaxID=1869184 RepID=UPI003B3BA949
MATYMNSSRISHSEIRKPLGFFLLSLDGTFVDCSFHFLQFTSYSAASLLGKSIRDVFTPETVQWIDQASEQSITSTKGSLVTRAGAEIQGTYEIAKEEQGIRFSYAESTEGPKPALSEDWSLMSKVVSHDLREPLRKTLLNIDMIRGNTQNVITPDSRMLLQITNDLSYRALQLLDAIQLYISLAHVTRRTLRPINLNEVLNKSWNKVQEENGLSSQILTAGKLPVVWGHSDTLQALFYQLLDNAVKFSNPQRPLQIAVQTSEAGQNMVQIHVRDNGLGFDPVYRTDVFQLFKQLNRNTAGCGAGLAISQKIVESHRGNIQAQTQVGEGTTITLTLPEASPSQLN